MLSLIIAGNMHPNFKRTTIITSTATITTPTTTMSTSMMTVTSTTANHIESIGVQSSRTLFHHINDIQETFNGINMVGVKYVFRLEQRKKLSL